MKKRLYSIGMAGLLLGATAVDSQTPPAPPAPGSGVDAVAMLKEIKAENEKLLQKQDELQKALDVLKEEARQLRIFAKRS